MSSNSPSYHNWKILQNILYAVSIFMFLEALLHFSGLRLLGTEVYWPESARSFMFFFQALWGSASLFLTVILWIIAQKPQTYRVFLLPVATLGVFHGFLLFYFAAQNFPQKLPTPALYLWNPYYDIQLAIEGLLLIIGSLWIIYTFRNIATE